MNDIAKFKFRQGSAPLLISMPHAGTHIPPALAARMTDAALKLPDTDWHLERLYDFAVGLGASVLCATHSRYVIDLNRPRDDANLYPGQDTTGLCPVDTFHKEPVYQDGQAPGTNEIEARVIEYWQPYHDKLSAELERIRAAHGVAMLWEAHSICSVLPRFFEGRLPDFNLGTAAGASCDPALAQQLFAIADAAPGYRTALDGRFKGGYITRQYGHPGRNIHAVQLELAQCAYMDEEFPFGFDETRTARLRPVLRRLIEATLDWSRAHS
jgi:N-formylglutamate deformylase